MSNVPTTTNATGLPSNLAGALCYLLMPLTGILFLVLERENRFVRFHAAQAVVVGAALFVTSIALTFVSTILGIIPIIGWLIGLFISLGFGLGAFIFWVVLMLRAYQGREWEVPVASDYARKLVAAPGA